MWEPKVHVSEETVWERGQLPNAEIEQGGAEEDIKSSQQATRD